MKRDYHLQNLLRSFLFMLVSYGCAVNLTLAQPVQRDLALSGGDVYGSMQWPELKKQYLGNGKTVFDSRIQVTGPRFAEDPMNVPIAFDASALQGEGGGIANIIVLVDRNPIRKVLEFTPVQVRPSLAFRFKLEQASPVRVAVQTKDGVWHIGGTWVEAAGGGCTVPGASRSDGSWSRTLNSVQAKFFPALLANSAARLRVKVMHPMDTGLVAGIPAFYVEQLDMYAEGATTADPKTPWFRLLAYEPVSENPVFSFDLQTPPQGTLILSGRDNNGNRIQAELAP